MEKITPKSNKDTPSELKAKAKIIHALSHALEANAQSVKHRYIGEKTIQKLHSIIQNINI